MTYSAHDTRRIPRRRALAAFAAAGLGGTLLAEGTAAAERRADGQGVAFLLGLDAWSLSFACGVRDVKPAKKIGAQEILEKVRRLGLKGAQVELPQMPKLGSDEFRAFRKDVEQAGAYWEVSAWGVQDEPRVLHALEYNAAMGSKIVRAFMEGFGLQFQLQGAALDDYVSEAMKHIKNLLPAFERQGAQLCLENHGGLRSRHLRRVLKAFPSEHLGVNLDTGNAVLTLEDPLETVEEFAPRTYTCHLKDWRLLRTGEGMVVRSCALGEGVVDLKNVVRILRARAPQGRPLHLNIEAPQEYLPLRLFTADFWRSHGEVTGRELERVLRLLERQNRPARTEDQIASMRKEPESVILAEEEAAIAQSAAYCRDVLGLL